ncbi:hypothetical protein B0A52_01801 [Exophiala mesophila]|uniref:separase n=1 Tax=Exophiala mesophila TaxID=212818 RepID=A0A438NG21_EXOME|nr:hypothetical protein B0A52_01801 [Exophiala mesophila]
MSAKVPSLEGLRKDLKSEAPSIDTLRYLRSILSPNPQKIQHASTVPSKNKSSKVTASTKPAPPKPKPKPSRAGPQAIPIHKDLKTSIPDLTAQDRRKLATEVFNSTLKQLGEAVKIQKAKLQVGLEPDEHNAFHQAPLQQRSPNKGKGRSADTKSKTKNTTKTSIVSPEEFWAIQAGCALTALCCLWVCDTSEICEKAALNQSLVNGSLILLDRSITLNLAAEAEAQAKAIYELHCSQTATASQALSHPSTTLSDYLLGGSDAITTKRDFNFTVSFQSQMLRLALLLGAQCVNSNLVQSLNLQTVGSPGWVTIQGLHLEHQTPETAGSQLRTISLAISKLHSIVVKSEHSMVQPDIAYSLFCIGLQIKFESWKYLHITPNPYNDVWRHFIIAMRKFTTMSSTPGHAELILTSIKRVQASLKSMDLGIALPPELLESLARAKAHISHHKGIDELIRDAAGTSDPTTALILKSESIVSSLSQKPTDAAAAMDCLAEDMRTFPATPKLKMAQLQRLLLAAAPLRKALLSMVSLSLPTDGDKPVTEHFQKSCTVLLTTCADFLFRQVKAISEASSTEMSLEQTRAYLASLLKNADVLVILERMPLVHRDSHSDHEQDFLEHSRTILSFVSAQSAALESNQALRTSVHQMQVRLSQAYWLRFLDAVESRKPTAVHICLLQSSLDGLDGLSVPQKIGAHACLKYQRLASCFIEINEQDKAVSALKTAINLDIQNGSLDVAVQRAQNHPFHQVWAQSESAACGSLGNNLATFARVSFSSSTMLTTDEMFFDPQESSAIHRAVAIDKQVYTVLLLGKTLNAQQVRCLSLQIKFLLELLSEPQYHVLQLGFLSRLLHLQLSSPTKVLNDLIDPGRIEGCLASTEMPHKDVYLHPYWTVLVHVLNLQYDMATGQVLSHRLEEHLHRLGNAILHCQNLESFSNIVENADVLLNVLQHCVNYAYHFETLRYGRVALEMMRVIMDHGNQDVARSKPDVLLQLARIHIRLHDVAATDDALCAAGLAVTAQGTDPVAKLLYAILQSEQHLLLENFAISSTYLAQARSVWETVQMSTNTSRKARLNLQTLLCQAANIASRLAFQMRDLPKAVIYARQSVKIIAGIWASIEKNAGQGQDDSCASPDGSLGNLATEMSRLEISDKHGIRRENCNAVIHCQHAMLYCSSFENYASLTSHCGSYQTAVFFLEQSLAVAKKAGLLSCTDGISSSLALLHARADKHTKAKESIQSCVPIPQQCDLNLERILIMIDQADTYLQIGEYETASKMLEEARQQLSPGQSKGTEKSIGRTAPKQQTSVAPRRKAPSKTAPPKASKAVESSEKSQIIGTLETKKALKGISAIQGELSLRSNTLVSLPYIGSDESDRPNPRKAIVEAQKLVHAALAQFSEDAANNVLVETAVGVPVRYKSSGKGGRVSFVQTAGPKAAVDKTVSRRSKEAKPHLPQDQVADGRSLLLQAYERICNLKKENGWLLPSDSVHAIHRILSQITLLSSALGEAQVTSSVQLLSVAMCPLDEMQDRAAALTHGEVATADVANMHQWPALLPEQSGATHGSISETVPKSMLESIPLTWSIVSVGLNDGQNELLVTRTSYGQSPFVLRIPLVRPDPTELDHEDLSFEKATDELQKIVIAANRSAHDARGCAPDKNTRKAWFAERQALDARLAALLENMENIWLGGFRGLLSSGGRHPAALSRFAKSMTGILNRHLPSRQRTVKGQVTTKVELHTHVLELFVALGHPRGQDLEESITDLIYFVIDVLRFNGERNAYDEIDFDSVLVEVLDALHAYHDEVSKANDEDDWHVVLILDKQLQAFPWESLPCMRSRSVSRMPSLKATWTRLESMRKQGKHNQGLVASSAKGMFILNPSSDLKSTQETFQPIFERQLSHFKGIINKVPSEADFENALSTDDVLLYFGHGGGAQYIRGGTIRKMKQCAVTLLMGCSSAKLTEYGVFESQGMPLNYISGGSAAVVGTLWDVTDRDIDRFAMELMTEWGLLEKNGEKSNKTGKRSVKQEANLGKASLSEAVAGARDSCLLKYLNGAAPVVYGVPVYLE